MKWQKDNVENQGEHLIWLLAGVQLRMFPNEEPPDDDPQPPDIQVCICVELNCICMLSYSMPISMFFY